VLGSDAGQSLPTHSDQNPRGQPDHHGGLDGRRTVAEGECSTYHETNRKQNAGSPTAAVGRTILDPVSDRSDARPVG